ncbi:hypothetical protein MesoLj113b_63550 [Mesorhizobium sp. 113-3-3]|nr:hypothetical protein MesoLj113b_63550 [Mesorhizobium sp. 113-3-3]BCG90689.1 hypothetical protein MesoLj113c_67990 [Mesorhizobium sp. 113-3-9]
MVVCSFVILLFRHSCRSQAEIPRITLSIFAEPPLKRRVTPAIKRQMRRRSAIEPVIGRIKAEHLGCNYLAGEQDDAVNAILTSAGYNFSLLLN